MSIRTSLLAIIALAMLTGVAPQAVAAQNCGPTCLDCGFESWEGAGGNPIYTWEKECVFNPGKGYCNFCPLRLAEVPSEANILATVVQASGEELRQVVRDHGHRLYTDTERGLVIIQGTPCDASALQAMAVMTQAQAAELQRLGVQGVEELFASEEFVSGALPVNSSLSQ